MVDGQGRPQRDVRVRVYSLLRDALLEEVRTDAEGFFEVELPQAGPLWIEASQPPAAAWAIAEGTGRTLEPLQLRPPASLRGSVEETGHHSPLTDYTLALLPRAPAHVLGWLAGTRWRGRARVLRIEEKRGRFELGGVAPGSYQLWVLAAGYHPWQQALELEGRLELPVVSLEPELPREVQACDPQGSPLPGAFCEPLLRDGLGQQYAVAGLRRKANAEGRLWTPLPPQLPLVLQLRRDTLAALLETDAEYGGVALLPRQQLRVLFPPGCHGVARVVEANGAASDPQWFEAELVLDDLPAGRYTVDVAASYGAGWVLSRFVAEHGGSSLTEVARRVGARLRLLREGRVLLRSADSELHLLYPDEQGRVELAGLPRSRVEASEGAESWQLDLEADVLEWE